VHEIVVPFVQTKAPQRDAQPAVAVPVVARSFPPGSEWLYAKLYTGVVTADRVLLDAIAPLAEAAVASGAADRWFFIRYADPREHLRVRFHGAPARLREDVLPTLLAIGSSQLAAGGVWKVQLDTYEREIERYGGPAGIELAEQLFCADSDAVVEILRLLDPGDEGNDERWRIVLVGLDTLLSDFGFDLSQKQEVVRRARHACGVEQREDTALRHALGDRHRKYGREIAALLAVQPDDDHPLAPGVAVLRRRSERLAPIVAELRARERDGRLSPGVTGLAGSVMHMHAIRALRTAAKRHEIVMYEMLLRGYLERARRSSSK
jgi:thiopeptide-type bacteriocin biosynthesis protein